MIGRLFWLSNCDSVNLQAETVAHRLRTGMGEDASDGFACRGGRPGESSRRSED